LILPRLPLDRQESRRFHFSNGRNYFKTWYARPVVIGHLEGACFGLRRVYTLRANLRVQLVLLAEVHAKYLLSCRGLGQKLHHRGPRTVTRLRQCKINIVLTDAPVRLALDATVHAFAADNLFALSSPDYVGIAVRSCSPCCLGNG
jgi:hypothetical protein